MIEFRRAAEDDAPRIAAARQKVWSETYRGIYPDEMIDLFDYDWHTRRERAQIEKKDVSVWLVLDGDDCVGYYTYGNILGDGSFWLLSLYLRSAYQRQGLGRRIFERICAEGRRAGYQTMMLDCSPHNENAMKFYRHMGGRITNIDGGHENRQEDSCYFEFLL